MSKSLNAAIDQIRRDRPDYDSERAAVLRVLSSATDADDARDLLETLGLTAAADALGLEIASRPA